MLGSACDLGEHEYHWGRNAASGMNHQLLTVQVVVGGGVRSGWFGIVVLAAARVRHHGRRKTVSGTGGYGYSAAGQLAGGLADGGFLTRYP